MGTTTARLKISEDSSRRSSAFLKNGRAGAPLLRSVTRLRSNPQALIMSAVIILVLYLVVVPLFFLLWSSFRSGPIGFPSELTLTNYVSAYGDARTYSLFATTLVFSI